MPDRSFLYTEIYEYIVFCWRTAVISNLHSECVECVSYFFRPGWGLILWIVNIFKFLPRHFSHSTKNFRSYVFTERYAKYHDDDNDFTHIFVSFISNALRSGDDSIPETVSRIQRFHHKITLMTDFVIGWRRNQIQTFRTNTL